MRTNIEQIYQQNVLPLPEKEQLRLAALIINKISTDSDEVGKPEHKNGDIAKFVGMFNSGNPDSADNEQIDRDLGLAYADNHEDED